MKIRIFRSLIQDSLITISKSAGLLAAIVTSVHSADFNVTPSGTPCTDPGLTSSIQLKSYTGIRSTHGELCSTDGLKYRRVGTGSTTTKRYSKTAVRDSWGHWEPTATLYCTENSASTENHKPVDPNDPCNDNYQIVYGTSTVNAFGVGGTSTWQNDLNCGLIPYYYNWPNWNTPRTKNICGTTYEVGTIIYRLGNQQVTEAVLSGVSRDDPHTLDTVLKETDACITKLRSATGGKLGNCDQNNDIGWPTASISTSVAGVSITQKQAQWRLKITGHASAKRYRLVLNWEDATTINGVTTIKSTVESRAGIRAPNSTPWCYPNPEGESLAMKVRSSPKANGAVSRKLISYTLTAE